MKKFLFGFIVLYICCVGDVVANPTMTFNQDECTVTINPNGESLDGWFVCITDGYIIGLHNDSENIECNKRLEIPESLVIDVSDPNAFCDAAIPNSNFSFGKIKSIYR